MKLLNTLFRYFPTPKYISMSHVGVDISATSIRFLELVRSSGKLRLGRYANIPLPTPLVPGQSFLQNKDLVAALKKLQRTYRLSFVEVAIPEEKAYLFTTEVPAGDDEVIRGHIEYHLEENVPISLAESVFDYHIIKNNKKGAEFASVAVVPAAVMDEYIQLFEICGMTAVSFLIENQALGRAVVKQNDMGMYLIVNVGTKKTVISVMSEQAVQFTSTVAIGEEDFTNAIIKEYSVTKEEAARLKKTKGLVKNADNTTFFLSLVNVASALRDEIQRVQTYWLSHIEKSGGDPSAPLKVLLAGHDSSIIGFREYMALSLKTPVELVNVWSNVFSFEDEIPPIDYLESLDYATVIGLALPKNVGGDIMKQNA
jgi:type IV pilus assembly protein PilM